MGELSGGQDHPESVVGGVAEAAGDAAVEFDDAVDGFGTAVAGPSGGEVGEELLPPGSQRAAEPGDLGNRAAGDDSTIDSAIVLPSANDVAANADRSRW